MSGTLAFWAALASGSAKPSNRSRFRGMAPHSFTTRNQTSSMPAMEDGPDATDAGSATVTGSCVGWRPAIPKSP